MPYQRPRKREMGAPQAVLFDTAAGEDGASDFDPAAPLAARMRPRTLDDYVGQEHIVGQGKILRRLIEAGSLPSIILWGPPGSGKTTLARIIANLTSARFVALSAVSAGVADLRRVVAEAKAQRALDHVEGRLFEPARTILFIDEIHRFNKAQQDAVLPYVEDGTVTLIGATTENPSFEVIGPLLSRARVFTLKALDEEQLAALLRRAVSDPERGLGAMRVEIDDEAVEALAASVGGDARIALNALEAAAMSVVPSAAKAGKGDRSKTLMRSEAEHPEGAPSPKALMRNEAEHPEGAPSPKALMRNEAEHPESVAKITRSIIEEALQHRTYLYDRQGDGHYDTISAFIKSLRGSDPDASLYWLARMVEAGEDPLFIVRRMVILAAEDIGLADPQALVVATACQQAVHFIGMPEGFLPLAETTLYLALAPKSNSALTAYTRALADVEATRNDPVPLHLRNAVTGLMRDLGYGRGYKYAHSYEGGIAPEQTYLPERLKGHRYYEPKGTGREGGNEDAK